METSGIGGHGQNVRRLAIAGGLAVGLALAAPRVASALPAPPSPVPQTSWVANGVVTDVGWSGHTLYIGGDFNRVGPPTGPFAVVSGTSGHQEGVSPIVSGGEASVEAIIPDGHGGWYIGGNFESVEGTPVRNLAHVTAGGTLDPLFAPNPDQTVHALVLSADGDTLYVAGSFHEIGGQDRAGIAAVSTSSGAALSGFTAGFNVDKGNVEVGTAVAVAPATNTLYAGSEHGELKAFDATTGTLDGAFHAEASGVRDLAVSPDGQTLYIAGASTVDGQSRNGLGAVEGATGAVTSFDPSGSAEYSAERLALTSDGATLYAGGLDGLAKIATATGTIDEGFTALTSEVVALALSPDQSKLYVSMASVVGFGKQPELAELDAGSGKVETSFASEPNGTPSVVATAPSGAVAIGGGRRTAIEMAPFNSLGGVARSGFAAIDETTGEPTSLELPDSSVFVVSPDGSTLYAIKPAPEATEKLIKVDTATDEVSSGFSAEIKGAVEALAISPNGQTLYLGGPFSQVDGHAADKLAAVNASDGSLKAGFAASTSGAWGVSGPQFGLVNSLTVSPDSSTLYIGGYFTEVDGQHRESLAAINAATGALDSGFVPSIPAQEGSSDAVYTTATNLAGSGLYVEGWFGLKLLETSTGDPSASFTPSPEAGFGLTLSPDGSTLYAGGFGNTRRLGAFDATTGTSAPAFNPAMQPDSAIHVLAFAPDGSLVAAGELTNVDQTPAGAFAIFPPSGGAPANAVLPEVTPPIAFFADGELTATTGTWAGAQPLSFSYQWLRDGTAIPGATSPSYQPTAADEGYELAVQVTATNGEGHASATSFPYVEPTSTSEGEGEHGGEEKPGGGSTSSSGAGSESGRGSGGGGSAGGSSTPSGSVIQAGSSPRAITAALAGLLSFEAPTIAALLKAGGYSLNFNAPSGGVLSIRWSTITAHSARSSTKSVVIATGTHTFADAGHQTIRLRLTAAGLKLLRRSRSMRITERASFASNAGTQTKQAVLVLHARKSGRSS
jgi:trimeric autotransporter adhesin